MSLALAPQPVPLKEDARGVIRVGGTRVTLDVVIAAFQRGATAEDIAQSYDTLALEDVYAVLAYYLRERSAVEVYLGAARSRSAAVRRENEARWPQQGLRERLLARRQSAAT